MSKSSNTREQEVDADLENNSLIEKNANEDL